MAIPYDDIFAVVRAGGDPRRSFDALRQIGRSQTSSPAFDKLRTPDVEADIWLAGAWLDDCIREFRPTLVSIGSDTLNQDGANGFNVDIGMSRPGSGVADTSGESACIEQYGSRHLIDGLYKVYSAYRRLNLGYPGSLLFDYLFFLGYSGVVLAAAVERIGVGWECLFRWGIGDDRLYDLVRTSPNGVTRLAADGMGA
jgi:hypothetical protein